MVCDGCPLNGNTKHEQCEFRGTTGGVLILGGFPDYGSIKNAFERGKGAIVRNMAGRIQRSITPAYKQPSFVGTYVCLCIPDFNKEAKRYDINTSVYSRCSVHALSFIDLRKPEVILALGAEAFHALGIKGSVLSRRGRVEHYKDKRGTSIPVVCTYDVSTIHKNPGLVKTFEGDMRKAFNIVTSKNTTEQQSLSCPIEYSEVLSKLNSLYEHIDAAETKSGYVHLAFDTETTSLSPHVKEDRVFSMSFSWCENKAMAFPYDYKTQPATPELKEAVERILNHPKVRLITTNGSFDMRWLWKRGIKCPNHYWDIMLAEHVLDETKQGCYGLKTITRDRFPKYANYEEELQEVLNETWQKKDDAIKDLIAQAKVQTSDNMREWWVALPSEERLQFMADWVSAGYVDLKDTPYLSEVRYVKRKGEMVIPKKYTMALTRMLNRVPDDVLPENIKAVPDIPEELEKKTYEDADLGVLLHYGALDAMLTLMIFFEQNKDMALESEKTKQEVEASKFKNSADEMPPLFDAFFGITMPLSSELARMQLHGIRVDRDKIREYQQLLKERSEQVTEEMRMETGIAFNPNSVQDLTKILFTDLGLPVLKYTDKGSPAVDSDTLKDLADEHPDVKFLENLMVYRKLDKTANTYLKNWLKLSEYDGCIHTEFLQTGTATFRLSSTNPW